MDVLSSIAGRFAVAGELITFLWTNKLWWMIPMITVLLGLGLLIAFGQSSALAPFIYTLF
jgi:hypothetical protein